MTSAVGPIVVLEGALVAAVDARISVFDRGFLFGDAVFEVLRAYDGRPLALDEHLARLWRSLDGLSIVPTFEMGALRDDVLRALEALAVPDAYVRLMVSRGQGALHLDPRRAAGSTTRVVIAAPLLPLPEDLYAGVAIASARVDRPTDHTRAAGAKISAYTANLLALQIAQAAGAYEAALVREDGAVTEGHSSNLFVVRGAAIETPPLSTGILAGITRALVLDEARAEGLTVRERLLFARDFETADEAFLTSSLREVVPVISIDGARIGSGRAGPITRRLHARYQARVRRELTRR